MGSHLGLQACSTFPYVQWSVSQFATFSSFVSPHNIGFFVVLPIGVSLGQLLFGFHFVDIHVSLDPIYFKYHLKCLVLKN